MLRTQRVPLGRSGAATLARGPVAGIAVIEIEREDAERACLCSVEATATSFDLRVLAALMVRMADDLDAERMAVARRREAGECRLGGGRAALCREAPCPCAAG